MFGATLDFESSKSTRVFPPGGGVGGVGIAVQKRGAEGGKPRSTFGLFMISGSTFELFHEKSLKMTPFW